MPLTWAEHSPWGASAGRGTENIPATCPPTPIPIPILTPAPYTHEHCTTRFPTHNHRASRIMHDIPSHDSHSLIVTAQGVSPRLRVATLNTRDKWVGFSIGHIVNLFEHDVVGNRQRPRTNMCVWKACRFHDPLASPPPFPLSNEGGKSRQTLCEVHSSYCSSH